MWLSKVPVLHPLFSYRQVIGRRIEPRTLSSSLSWSRRTLSSSASSQSSPKPPPREGILHYQWIRRTEGDVLGNNDELVPESTVVFVFLHGLFGHGTNLKRFAQQLCQRYLCAGLLIDLPGHGRSHGAAVTAQRPVTVADCAAAVGATLQHCLAADETPRIFGHSLGGRVAVQYALQSLSSQNNAKNTMKRPDHIWLLDTVPDVPDPTARLVLEILQSLLSRGSGPALRSDVRLWLSETESLSDELIEWLTMQWIETEGRFLFDVAVVRELLDDITNAEEAGRGALWDQMDALTMQKAKEEEGNGVPLHLIQAGSNPAWDAAHPRRLRDFRALAADTTNSGIVTHHILPTAGHWVHVDDLPGLLRIIASVHGVRKRRKPYRYD